MTPKQMRAAITTLSPSMNATNAFSAAVKKREGVKQRESKTPWYATQKEHWLGWLGEIDGPGFYGRKTSPKTAAAVYAKIVNPQMLLWLVEASGIDTAAAVTAALEKTTMSGMAGAIRRAVPWPAVEVALSTR